MAWGSPIYICAYADNLGAAEAGAHILATREAIHVIQMLRKGSLSSAVEDVARLRTHVCFRDALAESSAALDALKEAADTGAPVDVDLHPSVRTLVRHGPLLLESAVFNLGAPLHGYSSRWEAPWYREEGSPQ